MKKNLTLLTGIVILFTIMIAGACKTTVKENDSPEGTDSNTKGSFIVLSDPNVTIYLNKIVEIDGKMHLEMYDSKDTTKVKIDSLITEVHRGDIIHWKTVKGSGIKKIHDIRPVREGGTIFPIQAQTDSLRAAFQTIIPKTAKPGTTEKYEIVFKDNNDDSWCIDPHLRIPPTTNTTEDSGDR